MNRICNIARYLSLAFIGLIILLPCRVSAQEKFIIVLDAGHGGKDPGAVNGKNQEKTINLNVTLRVGQLLEQNCPDVKVIYTRKTDVFVELYKRADIANKAGADLFVSIHTNAAKSSSAYGAETYLLGVEENRTSANLNVAVEENKAILYESDYETHYEGYDPNSPESQIIFEFMQSEYTKESLKVATMVQNGMIGEPKRHDRGVHQAGYLVLWKSAMPSILIELGFISNPNEVKYLTSAQGVEELSQSIYKAFVNYISDVKGKSPVATVQTAAPVQAKPDTPVVQTKSDKPVFKIQFMTTPDQLPLTDSRFKGYQSVECHKDGKLYKYTCGNTGSYNEILKTQTEVRRKYKDAFIIALLNGERISISEAKKLAGE